MSDTPHCPNCGSSETSFKKKASQWECADCEQRFTTQESSSRPQRREWLFANIESWLSQSEQRGFWLMSDPGMGKSSIAARLAHTAARQTVAYHFCRFDEPGTCNPHTFVCTLAFQLAARLPGYRELVLNAARYPSKPLAELQADELFTLLLTNPLCYSIDGGQSADWLLVIVDALDEAPAIAALLTKRQNEFPAWVALLLTSRPDANIRSAFAGLELTALTTDDPRNLTDLPPAEARELLLERSQGNILYLAHRQIHGERICLHPH